MTITADLSKRLTASSHVATRLPVAVGEATCHLLEYDDHDDVVVVEFGSGGATDTPLVRVHSACVTGDLFGSLRCDCGPQLRRSLKLLACAPWGLLAYVPSHEGRGVGLREKLRAYCLQDGGLDTFEANIALGHDDDERRYESVAAALGALGVEQISLLTRNPRKSASLEAAGITIRSITPLDLPTNLHNADYLASKFRWFLDQ